MMVRLALLTLCLLGSLQAQAAVLSNRAHRVQSFVIDLSKNLGRMLDLIKNTHLPTQEEYPGVTSDLGIPLSTLKNLQKDWVSSFNWKKEQDSMNIFKQFTTVIEDLTIHFIHEKSDDPNAIPLILNHGWPGSFLEFVPVIQKLTKKAQTSTGKSIAFHVVIPSLPGFAFSTPPPQGWTAERDTARVFNTLMVDVLDYKTYATFGTDWGSSVAYGLYEAFNTTCRAGHFAFLPFLPQSLANLQALNVTLDSLEAFEEQVSLTFSANGASYDAEQTFKPNIVGLALHDSPMGQMAWIGEKYLNWSDPRAGTGPSVLTHNEILRSVSLYYLTQSFVSSVFIYADNPGGFKLEYTKAQTDAPMLFSAFKYNTDFWPEELVVLTGNLVLYRNHDFGGHFPGLDNPAALIDDLREIGIYWTG